MIAQLKSSSVTVVALTMLASLLGGCANAGKGQIVQEPIISKTWPAPPSQPRIRYLGEVRESFTTPNEKRIYGTLARAIFGEEKIPLARPHGLVKSDNGYLFVVDTEKRIIFRFNIKDGSTWRFPENLPEGFSNPVGITVAQDGRLFVSDSGSGRIHVWKNYGKKYLRGISLADLIRPTGIVYNDLTDELFVVDTKTSSIFIFDGKALSLKRKIENPDPGSSSDSYFHFPTNIAVGRDGDIYVADSLNFRVQVLDSQFRFVSAFGAPGNAPGHFSRPKGIAVDSDNNIYVVDALFDNIQIFNPEGQLLLAFGSPGSGAGEFWLPTGIFIDADDRVYVSDSYNSRVQVFQYISSEVDE